MNVVAEVHLVHLNHLGILPFDTRVPVVDLEILQFMDSQSKN